MCLPNLTLSLMVRWHHRLNGHEFEQTLGDSEGQISLAYCSPWGCKETPLSDWMTITTIWLGLETYSEKAMAPHSSTFA